MNMYKPRRKSQLKRNLQGKGGFVSHNFEGPKPAKLHRRAAAFGIDLVLMALISLCALPYTGAGRGFEVFALGESAVYFIAGNLVGGTLGQRALGLMVIRQFDGKLWNHQDALLGLGVLTLRFVFFVVSIYFVAPALASVILYFRSIERVTLWDVFTGTRVLEAYRL